MLGVVGSNFQIFNTQHVTTRCNSEAKCTQHVALNNVAICCAEMLRSFGRSFQMLGCVVLIRCDRLAGALRSGGFLFLSAGFFSF